MRKRLRCGFLVLLTVATISARRRAPSRMHRSRRRRRSPPLRSGRRHSLRPGQVVTLRVRQVIPRDGMSPGDRVLNGLPTLVPGDRVLAEVLAPGSHPAALVGGTVARVAPPRRFGKPGKVTLELGQLVTRSAGQSVLVPWAFDLEDRRFNVQMRRKVLLALFAAEGAGLARASGRSSAAGTIPTSSAGARESV